MVPRAQSKNRQRKARRAEARVKKANERLLAGLVADLSRRNEALAAQVAELSRRLDDPGYKQTVLVIADPFVPRNTMHLIDVANPRYDIQFLCSHKT